MRAELWGPDHVELGDIASAAAGAGAAVALSRGRFAKTYRHVDPNEDVAAAVAGPRATLLLVCDGHNGSTAPVLAARAVLAELGADPPPGLSDREWIDLFDRVNGEVMSRTGSGSEQPASRTVLLVALLAGRRLSWAGLGDAALVLARAGGERGRQLNREASRFVGYPMGRRTLSDLLQRGATDLEPEEWVVLVTDGLSEFILPRRPADEIPRVLGSAAEDAPGHAEYAARALIRAAFRAGAGDNVAAAVHAPPTGPPPV